MMQHIGDITKIDGATIEPVWCVTGGSPCQDLSIAGKRAGLAGARSGLFIEQIRVIKEMREHDKQLGWAGELIRPRYMVWENVPGALSSNKGRDFAAVLEETIRIVEPEAPSIEVPAKGWPTWGGYRDVDGRWSVAWRVHDAQYWGVPQRRRRIALVADFGGDTAHEILFERTGVSGDLAPRGEAGERPAGYAEAGASYAVRIRGGCEGGGKGALIQTEKSGTLGTGNDQTIFCYGISAYESNAMKSSNPKSGVYVEDTSRTLDLNCGNPACNQGGICVVEPVAADLYNATLTGDTAATVTAMTGRSGDASGPTVLEPYGCGGAEETVMPRMVVRRLTPLECERLQGFPDGWTDIGDWVKTDKRGRKIKVKGSADSPRYKALGNSIALPFWRWMFGRMAAYLPECATLGSLFDGIGGFPLCWEDVHGAGTAVWASEIEEFPIAVTKKRFGSENMIHYTLNIEPPVEPPAYTCPICPVCGAETDTVYKNVYGDPVGCPECVTEVDAWAE